MFNSRTVKWSIVLVLILGQFILGACAAQTSIPTIVSVTQKVPTATIPPSVVPTVPESTPTAKMAVGVNGSFEVNGHSLYLACLGTGSPTIVLETGEGGTVSDMLGFQQLLSSRTTTCAYDRAVTGDLRTAKDVIEDLHTLLAVAKVPSPYLLVGHSAGGLFVQLYARTFPDQVVGVVAMNPVPPAHPWLDKVQKVFTAQEYADEEAYYQGQNGESFDYLASNDQLTAAAKPPAIPFEMLISTDAQCEDSSGPCMKSYSIYEQLMQGVTAAWPQGHFSQVTASHEIYGSDPKAAAAAVERILALP